MIIEHLLFSSSQDILSFSSHGFVAAWCMTNYSDYIPTFDATMP